MYRLNIAIFLPTECSVVDEREVKNCVKNGREVMEMECSVVDVKKEDGFEEVRKDKWADWKEYGAYYQQVVMESLVDFYSNIFDDFASLLSISIPWNG
ncbi:hypothetical protein Tco_1014354 [Tanacetum coccineum]